ncbi:zf-HC2 domain-containing protein [Streptomyces sp. XM83C]|uniref:Zf-HC2 domain-containing protein n=1 Tax=Streptomyces thermocoprophilus TaxID=78356 RepID=A0ABV5V7R3_9ACTN|nr:zf-HC2 domain-containing protein [Streptomyces sp. XM83C]MCK1822261.1 zf-HC2 domain-containing protein [Streptomyces sp. XM83C]
MRSLERHRDVAAYALGVLDEADAFRFEDHLMECVDCSARVTEFGPVTRQLMLYRRATPRTVHPAARPGPRMLERLTAELAVRQRRARRRTLYVLAACLVAAVAGPALVMTAGGGPKPMRVAATDERSGVWAQVTAENAEWGTRVELTVKDGAGPRTCRLIVVGRDGSEETVTSWRAQEHDARPDTVQGGAALHPDQIDHYEVRTDDGEHLVTLDPP